MTVAVIGAGVAGVACARQLALAGVPVRVFDKGRGAGGRLSTRRLEPWQFDHGAQYLTVKHPAFRAEVSRWQAAGAVQLWSGRFARIQNGGTEILRNQPRRYVGTPGMSAVIRQMTRDLAVHFNVQVTVLRRVAAGWRLQDSQSNDLGVYDRVVVAVPAPQAGDLLGTAPELARRVANVPMLACWSLMLAYDDALELPFDGAFIHGGALAWAARNNSKPHRSRAEAWVLHGSRQWSEMHMEAPVEGVALELMSAFAAVAGRPLPEPVQRMMHRWRYAAPLQALGQDYLYDAERGLGVCGDWCLGPRIEAAWLSGQALARRLLV